MDLNERIGAVAAHLQELFSCGADAVSRDDVMDDGRVLADAVGAILEGAARRPVDAAVFADVLPAFETISGVWGSGFDLASGSDLTDADLTVADTIAAHVAAHGAPSPA